uniref:Tetratricopeptide repeat protein 16-like n=1 Tax=Phallusia mammillata TaxID=59560 RepID=A0A6F9DWS7_9ASCI|nr:tetratricopeptide repeat protein 16-like [Phallusia mammillata]
MSESNESELATYENKTKMEAINEETVEKLSEANSPTSISDNNGQQDVNSEESNEKGTPTSKSSGTLFVESEQKISPTSDTKDMMSVGHSQGRPTSAGRQRTPPVGEGTPTGSDVHEVTNTRNLVAFDTDLQDSYPERTDSETDLIIKRLKETLATPQPTDEGDKEDSIFPTSVPEEDLEEARKRQKRRMLEREAKMWDRENAPSRKGMQDVVDERVDQHFNRGIELSNEGRFESAISSFSKAINLQPTNVNCYVERAESYLQLCDFRSAHLNYKKAFSLEPHNPDLFDKIAFISYMEGQCLFDQGLYSEALESFTRAAEMKPSISGYHLRAIACLACLNRNQECLALITRRLEAETTGNPELYVLRARLHRIFKNATLSYYDVRDALSLDSEQPEAKQLMREIREVAETAKQQAVSLTIQGKLHEALKKIATAVDADPSISEYHVFRGALYRRMQNFNAAIDDYLLAMDKADHNEQDPVYLDAQRQLLLTYNDFAVYCYHREFFEEAIVLLNKAIKGEKNEKGLYLNRGDCFFKINDLSFALADYQQALEIDSTCWNTRCRIAVVHNEFGILAYQDRQYQEAAVRFSSAIEHNGKVGQFYVHRARSRYLMQDVDAARNDILISLHLDPNNDEVWKRDYMF